MSYQVGDPTTGPDDTPANWVGPPLSASLYTVQGPPLILHTKPTGKVKPTPTMSYIIT